MILSRLGIITDEVSSHLEEALDWAEHHGLSHVEIRTIGNRNAIELTDQELLSVRREVERRGLFVSCFASPVLKCALSPNRAVAHGDVFGAAEAGVEEHFAMLDRAIEIAGMLGTRNIRVFSFWREEDPKRYQDEIIRYLNQAAVLAERKNVVLLLENEPSCNGGFAAEVAELVARVGSSALKSLWDPGNEVYGGASAFPDGYMAIRSTLGHVHLKDAMIDNSGSPKCVPIGEGWVPFVAQLRALAEDGYSGLFTIETHYTPEGGSKKDGSAMSLQGLRNLLPELERTN